jgi:hypothetical protein
MGDFMHKIGNNFKPAFEVNNVTIILSSSDSFSPYLAVCIKSILLNRSLDKNYDIIVFEREICEDNKKKILSLKDGMNNVSIRFFFVSDAMGSFKFYLNSTRLSQETYYGLLIPYLLPNYHKGIIMDCDMIVKTDIARLYYEDLGENVIGGVNDIVLQGWLNDRENKDTYTYYTEYLKIKNPYKCFNGGLIILNFDKYKKLITENKISDYINNYKLRVVDQDIFNILLEGKSKLIDFRWNHMIWVKGAISEAIADAPKSVRDSYFKSRKAPYIVHYAGDVKPWYYPQVEFADEFWDIARQTPFYEIILFNMVRNEAVATVYTHQAIFHKTIKQKIFTPIRKAQLKRMVIKVFPVDTVRYRFLRKFYYKLRGRQYTE